MTASDGPGEASRSLVGIAQKVEELAREVERGSARREAIDEIVAELRAVQVASFGDRARATAGKGAKSKILAYLVARTGEEVSGDELAEISGIREWPRRVRELRVEDGYEITELGSSVYRLEVDQPN